MRWTNRDPHSVRANPQKPEDHVMPRGDKSSYSGRQKRKAAHIEKSYEKRGVSKKTAAKRAWATVNKQEGGGAKKGSGRKKTSRKKTAAKKGARKTARKPSARKTARKSSSARKTARRTSAGRKSARKRSTR
jgi:hypothetical protein